jgi:hypothetical protein
MLHNNSKIFIADKDFPLEDKELWEEEDKSASSATLMWPTMVLALSIQQSTTSGRNAGITLTINRSSKAHSPSHPHSIESKLFKTMSFCQHLMTKLSSCGDITAWGTSLSLY